MTTTERLDQHDKQIASIRVLVKAGMQLVIDTRNNIRQARKDLRTVIDIQKRTAQDLHVLVNSLKGGGDVHGKKKLDRQ